TAGGTLLRHHAERPVHRAGVLGWTSGDLSREGAPMMAIVVGCLGFLAVPIALVLTRACGGLKPADQPDPPLPPWVSAVARVLMPLLWIVGALAVGFYVVAVVFGAVAWAAPYVFPALLLGGLSFVTTLFPAPGATGLA